MKLKVITSSPEGFLVNSTLIYGEKDAILIDAQFTNNDAQHVVDSILESKKNLTTIYITHFHPDHYFGLVVLKKSFPKVKIVATPPTIKHIKETWKGKVEQWKPMYGDSITSSPIVPEPLMGSELTIEGEKLQIFSGAQGDCTDSSYVWVPSLKAVICGDIVYSGVYPWTAETTPEQRKAWTKSLDMIASLNPSIVVAGHKNPDLKDDLSSLQFTKNYLSYFDKALTSSKTGEEFKSKIKSKFSNLALEVILNIGSDAVFKTEQS